MNYFELQNKQRLKLIRPMSWFKPAAPVSLDLD